MEAKLYCDGAGYMGSDLKNKEQPYFVLASVQFTEVEILKGKGRYTRYLDSKFRSS